MTEAALRKLWTFFATFALTFSVYAFLRTTGLKPSRDVFGLLDLQPSELPLLAVPLEVIVFAVTLWLTRAWVRDVGGATWPDRFPTFYLDREEIKPTSPGGRLYQRWMFFLFLLLPGLLMLHMFGKFIDAPVFWDRTGNVTVQTTIAGLNQFDTLRWWADYCSPGFCRYATASGPQYYLLQPWIYLVAVVGVGIFWVRVGVSVLRSHKVLKTTKASQPEVQAHGVED